MVARRAAPIGAVWLLALLGAEAGCTTPTPFACDGNGQCQLDGAGGVCTELGHCAYPDAGCSSGLRYPAGVPGGLGEECADGDPVGTGTSSDSTSTSGTGTTEPPPTTGPVTTDPVTTFPDPVTTTMDPSDGSTSQGSLCPDPWPNDDPANLVPIDLMSCNGAVMEMFDDNGGVDWHLFDSQQDCFLGSGFGSVTVTIDQPAQLCAFFECPNVLCGDESPPIMEQGLTGCCSDTQQVFASPFSCDGPVQLFVRVTPFAADGQACAPYTVTVNANAG